MERPVSSSGQEHVVEITPQSNVASSSSLHSDYTVDHDLMQQANTPSSGSQDPPSQPSSSTSTIPISISASSRRRDGNFESFSRRHRSPLNSGFWISIELIITISQITASLVVLSLSRHENPRAPLFAWVVGYACGCVATLPLLYRRYCHRNHEVVEQEGTRRRQSSQNSYSMELPSYNSVSVPQDHEVEGRPSMNIRWWNGVRIGMGMGTRTLRLSTVVERFKMALDCFFAVWFVVGNVWIFGGHSSSNEAPNLYRLCIVFLSFSCIGYAMPFILCAAICCCFPCIISILGSREDLGLTRGAALESINILPIYKFKSKRIRSRGKNGSNSEHTGEGGILAAGTDKEQILSAEDAVCCICLTEYADNDEIRELPCMHFFHVACVDKWLNINATCPLCKSELG